MSEQQTAPNPVEGLANAYRGGESAPQAQPAPQATPQDTPDPVSRLADSYREAQPQSAPQDQPQSAQQPPLADMAREAQQQPAPQPQQAQPAPQPQQKQETPKIEEGLLDNVLDETFPDIDIRVGDKSLQEVNPEAFRTMVKVSKEGKLSKEQAQYIYDNLSPKFNEYAIGEANKMFRGWREQTLADPDLGGQHINTTIGKVQSVVQKYGDQDFVHFASAFKFLEHPAVMRFMSRVADATAQDSRIVTGATRSKPERDTSKMTPSEVLSTLYDNSEMKGRR